MSRLIIRASFGPIENRQTKEAVVDDLVSQKVLSVFFRCEPKDLEKTSIDNNIPQEILNKGPEHTRAIFYKVDVIPQLLSGLKNEFIKQGNTQGKEWLTSLDTEQDTFEFRLPSGAVIIYKKG